MAPLAILDTVDPLLPINRPKSLREMRFSSRYVARFIMPANVHNMHQMRKHNVHAVLSAVSASAWYLPRMRLAEIRTARGLSQDDLAEMIDVNRSTISRAESMHNSAKLETYLRCADALGVSLADLFADSMDPVERELLSLFRHTPDVMKPHFLQLMRSAKSQPQTTTQ